MKPQKHRPNDGNRLAGVPRRRVWWFRFGALILVPLLLLGSLELGLRLFGYGYPTSFFIKTKIDGQDFLVPNDKFGFRFFPRALARNPLPMRMAAEKRANTIRIFLFGESAALGDPDPTFGVGRYLEVLLRERFPGTDFEVVCVGMTAINSHVILPIARECARRQGDLWIIYMGNNEMVGPFGASTVLGARAPNLGFIRASLAVRTTKIGQLLDAIRERLGGNASNAKSWGGMKMFTDRQLRYDDADRLRVYAHFRENLEDILRAGLKSGVPIILSTVGSNLKDCAPFGSLHSAKLDATRRSTWDEAYQQGVTREAAGDYPKALEAYAKAAEIDPEFADLRFRMGTCHLALANNAEARRNFELARDYDTLDFRADTRINQTIADAGARHVEQGVHFVDATEILAKSSPAGISGQEFFYEHVHLDWEGNYALARAFAEQVAALLPKAVLARIKGAWAPAEFCDHRLGLTVWDRYRLWQTNLRRISEAPFIGQSDHAVRIRMYEAKLNEIAAQMNSESPEQARDIYKQAVAQSPNDYFLHGNFAEFLEATGDLEQALKEQEKIRDLLPQNPVPYYKIGRYLVRQGKAGEAAEFFAHALAIDPGFVQALNEMGLLLANQRKPEEAASYFARALRRDPNYSQTYVDWGFMQQTDGKLDAARARYGEAARLEVNGPATYFDRAIAAASEHRRGEAIAFFQEAIQLRPEFWQAHYLLGVELAEQEKVEEARAQFSEAIRYRPDYGRAHVNLGVALAKQGKLDEALAEFQESLRLNPTNKLARQHLETVQAMIKRRGQ